MEGSTLTIDLNSNLNNETQGDEEVMEELSRVKSENKRLTDLLTIVTRNLSDFKQLMRQRECEEEEEEEEEDHLSRTRKRKADDDDDNMNIYSGGMPNTIRSNVSKVYVRIDPLDATLVVRDGYQWRKYGQKVTRDNPSPRAYYKCSFSPACPVKKKVQRSVDDPTLLVAIYEGQHLHHHCWPPGVLGGGDSSISVKGGSGSTPSNEEHCSKIHRAATHHHDESNEIQQFLVDKMASSLTKNRGFTTALAAAITGRLFDELISSENSVIDDINDVSNSRGFSV